MTVSETSDPPGDLGLAVFGVQRSEGLGLVVLPVYEGSKQDRCSR